MADLIDKAAVVQAVFDWEQGKISGTIADAIAAIEPAEAGGVDGRPDAPCHIVEYTNWRGETARRAIIPIRMWWGKTEWHPQEQWMLTAWDVEKEATRDFAWQDMKPVQNGATSAAVAAQRAAPALVDALVKTAEALTELRAMLIDHGFSDEGQLIRKVDAALAAEKAKVAKLVEAAKDAFIVLEEFHIGPESPVIAALRAAITEAGQ